MFLPATPTESINLVAACWGRKNLKPGDEVLISEAEHHANLVPWQMLRDELGFTLKIFKMGDDGSYIHEEFLDNLTDKTKLVFRNRNVQYSRHGAARKGNYRCGRMPKARWF